MRRSKIMFACWIVVAVFLGSCDRSPEATLAKHVKRGDGYVKEEKFKEAVIEYRNAVKAVPKDPAAHWKLAKASIETKDIRTAFAELQKTVELDPNNFEALGKLGEIYVMVGKKEEATQIADNLGEEPAERSAGVHPPVRTRRARREGGRGDREAEKSRGTRPEADPHAADHRQHVSVEAGQEECAGVVRQGAGRRSERRGRSRDAREFLFRIGRSGRGGEGVPEGDRAVEGEGDPPDRAGGALPVPGAVGGQREGAERGHQGDELPEGAETPGRDQARDGEGGRRQADRRPGSSRRTTRTSMAST